MKRFRSAVEMCTSPPLALRLKLKSLIKAGPGRMGLLLTRRHMLQVGAAAGLVAAARPAAAATVFATPKSLQPQINHKLL
jgi:hypothetical protein